MKTSVEFRWILNENGMQAFRCMSNLNDIQDRGYLCIDVDTGEPFVFTAGEKSKLAVCQL